jgi:hypothetical protein
VYLNAGHAGTHMLLTQQPQLLFFAPSEVQSSNTPYRPYSGLGVFKFFFNNSFSFSQLTREQNGPDQKKKSRMRPFLREL